MGGGEWHGRVWSSVGRDRCVRGVGRRMLTRVKTSKKMI